MTRLRRRHGFTLFELLLSMGVLGIACAIFIPLLMASAQQRRLAIQDDLALMHVSNELEILTLLPRDEISVGEVDVSHDQNIVRHLPGARRRIAILPGDKATEAFRVVVTLIWKDQAGRKEREVSLTGWNFPSGRGQP